MSRTVVLLGNFLCRLKKEVVWLVAIVRYEVCRCLLFDCLFRTCIQYSILVLNTCTQYLYSILYSILVLNTCTQYLYSILVLNTCTQYLYSILVFNTCTQYLYSILYIQYLSIIINHINMKFLYN